MGIWFELAEYDTDDARFNPLDGVACRPCLGRDSLAESSNDQFNSADTTLPGSDPTAREILNQRYARGEIDAATFEQMRERLEASDNAHQRSWAEGF